MATKADIDKWIAAQGGPDAVSYGYEDVEVDNPAFNNPDHPNYQGRTQTPEKVKTRRETWTSKATGASYSAVRTPYGNDEFQDIKEMPGTKPAGGSTNVPTNTTEPYIVTRNPDGSLRKEPNPNYVPPAASTAPAAPPTTDDRGGRHYVWKPNPGGPNAGGQWVDVGSAPLTADERAAAEANQPTQSVTTKQVGGKTYTVITIVPKPGQPGAPGQIVMGPDGQIVPGGIPGEPPKDTTTTVTRNGKTYIQHSVQKPDGSSEIYHTDQSGARVQLPDETKPGDFAGEPADAPAFDATPGHVMAGLQQYSQWLNAKVRLWKESGGKQGIAPDEASRLMDRRLAMAKGTADEQAGLVTAQTNIRGQDITQRGQTLQDTQGRRSAAETAYKNVLDLLPLASKLGPGGAPALAALMGGLLGNQRDYIGSYGGFRESPEVGTPGVLDQIRQAAMTGINNAAQGGPTIFESRPPAGAAPAVTANAAAAPPDPAGHAASIMANPVFRPQPVAPAPYTPTPAVTQTDPQASTPPPIVPVATNPIDNSPVAPPPGSVASLLMSGAQGMAGAAPMPSQSQLAALLGRGSQGARQEPDVYDGFPQNMPASPWLQQMQQGAAWDSNTHGAAVAARLGIPDDIFKQAVAGLYGQAA